MKTVIKLLVLTCLIWGTTVRAEDVSLHDKIGQMLIIGFQGKEVHEDSAIVKSMAKSHIGGVILFDYDYQRGTFDKNIESPTQVKTLNERLKQFNQDINFKLNRVNLPLFIAVDYEGGSVNRLKEVYGFPPTVSAAEVGKMTDQAANEVAFNLAKTLKNVGFNLDFAPVVDVNINPDNPIIGKLDRSFSADPDKVAAFSEILTRQFLQAGIQCAYKHFPGHGSSLADSHLGFVDVTHTWEPKELLPYQQLAIAANACGMVMTAHIINKKLDESGVPATLSHKMLTGLLREELKFEGVIITDDMQMKAITDHYGLEQALTMAVNAGADMFIFGNQLSEKPQDPEVVIAIIEHQVQLGHISEARIDDAYRRIVDLKSRLI